MSPKSKSILPQDDDLSQEINEQKSKINLIPKSTRKRITKSQVRRRQEIISLRAEINEIEMNKRIAKIK